MQCAKVTDKKYFEVLTARDIDIKYGKKNSRFFKHQWAKVMQALVLI